MLFDTVRLELRDRGVSLHFVAARGNCERTLDKARDETKQQIILKDSDGRLNRVQKDVFLMVEVMESWFLADRQALQTYYGSEFHSQALPQNPRVEEITKRDVLEGLKKATSSTKKGAYHKTRHAPSLLEKLKPAMVRKAAPHADRFWVYLEAL